jgi:hypothetical protein
MQKTTYPDPPPFPHEGTGTVPFLRFFSPRKEEEEDFVFFLPDFALVLSRSDEMTTAATWTL